MNGDKYRCPHCGRLLEVVATEEYGSFNSYIVFCPGTCFYSTELDEDGIEILEALHEKEANAS